MPKVSTLLALACLPACIDAGTNPTDDVDETVQDLSSVGLWSWGQLDGHLDMGSSTNQTCFLRGVHGSLDGTDAQNNVSEAGAVISIQNGHWDLYTFHGAGPGVSGQATCIPNTANRTFLSTLTGPSSIAATANRQCFLTSVRSYGNSWVRTFPDGSTPSATLQIVNGNWVLSAHVVQNQNPDGVIYGGHEEAVCVDVPITGIYGWTYTAGGSTFTTQIVPPSATGWACGLTALRGVFTQDWNQPGAEAYWSQNTNAYYLTLAANKGADVRCIY